MERQKLGKIILTFVIAVTTIVSTLVDWNETHLFNPKWHPHAIFHDALMLLFLAGMSAIALWMLWRPSKEPAVGIKVAAALPIFFWTPFYYITTLLPGSSLNAFDETLPEFAGITLYPNVIIGTVLIVLAMIGYWFARPIYRD